MNFSREELLDMTLVFGECESNALLASRVYQQKYPQRRHPRVSAFRNLERRFTATGNIQYPASTRVKRALTEENETTVMTALVENPHVSTRQLARLYDLGERTIGRIIKKNHFHDYHIQYHQNLVDNDYPLRTEFCQWANNKLRETPDFLDHVLWTDESTFQNTGQVNQHNFHYYSDVNPHFFRELNRQNRWSLNVWGGILGTRVVGPFFYGNLTGQTYHRFLEYELGALLEEVPLDIRRNMWYQHDGAPAHSTAIVREWLNRHYHNKWIGRGGPIHWPARSPDLTPLDYFLWGHVKNTVYSTPPTTAEDMKNRIRTCFRNISEEMLMNVQRSFRHRLDLCIANYGGHFEQML